jgi:hypothetical protein
MSHGCSVVSLGQFSEQQLGEYLLVTAVERDSQFK